MNGRGWQREQVSKTEGLMSIRANIMNVSKEAKKKTNWLCSARNKMPFKYSKNKTIPDLLIDISLVTNEVGELFNCLLIILFLL